MAIYFMKNVHITNTAHRSKSITHIHPSIPIYVHTVSVPDNLFNLLVHK